MATVSKLKLAHPILGEEGGTALHDSVESLYERIGDNINTRFFTHENLANAASIDFDHNFITDFDNLRIDIYQWDSGTGELVLITDLTNWVIAAKVGNETTHIRVTNNTGSIQDIALTVVFDPLDVTNIKGLNGEPASSIIRVTMPQDTLANLTALPRKAGTTYYATDTKKFYLDDGAALKIVGGGLVPTNITVSGTTPSIATLESGKHYIYNGAGASGDVTVTMPAVAAESDIRITVYNIPTTRKLIVSRAGSDNFRKDDTLYTTVEFVAVEVEQSAEFLAATDANEWLVDDGSNALGTVWGGSLSISGTFKADTIEPYTSSGIVLVQSSGSTQLSVKGVGSDPRMRFYSDSTSRGVIAYDATNKFYVMSEGELRLYANGGSGGVQPVRISTSGFMDVGRSDASGCVIGATSASNTTMLGAYATNNTSYNAEVMFLYSAMASGSGYKFIRCDNATQAAIFYVDGRGYIYAGSTTVSSSSDARLKDNITTLPDGSLSKILQLKPSTWTWRQEDRAGETKGFIAQDVEAVYPEFVEEDADGYKTLGINGAPMIAELVKAMQEQQKQIEELKAEIAAMRGV